MKNYFRRLLFESFLATILVFIVMWLFFMVFNVSIKPLNILANSLKEINLTDLYMGHLKARQADPDIAIVNVSDLNRCQQAELIGKIARSGPAVIGMDVLYQKDSTAINYQDTSCYFQAGAEALRQVFADHNNKIVQAQMYGWENNTRDDRFIIFPEVEVGIINNLITTEDKTTPVREFIALYKTGEDTLVNLSYQMVRKMAPEMYKKAISRSNRYEMLNYTGNGNSFLRLEGEEILSGDFDPGSLKDKMVFVGFTGKNNYGGRLDDIGDLYYTPMNAKFMGKSLPDMYGVTIHANIASMVRKAHFIERISGWLFWLAIFLITYLHVLSFVYLFLKRIMWYRVSAKLIQLFSLLLITLAVFWLLEAFSLSVNIKYLFIAIFVSVDTLLLYEALAIIVFKKWHVKSIFIR